MNIKQLKNLTVFQFLTIFFCLFIFYAAVDIGLKIREHRKYDMQKIFVDIQKIFPKARLTFQNINIEENQMLTNPYARGSDNTYYESYSIYIKNNQLIKEPNFLWLIIFLPILIILSLTLGDIRILKVKDLGKADSFAYVLIVIFLFCAFIMNIKEIANYSFEEEYETQYLLDSPNLDPYKISRND